MCGVSKKLSVTITLFFALELFSVRLFAQKPDQVRRAFVDLRDDDVPHNCEHATEWLFKYREQLKDQLIDELYQTDWQGREAILHILYNTASFKADSRFFDFVTTDLTERNTRGEDWIFIEQHFGQFKPLLKQLMCKTPGRPHGMYVLWCITWLAKKHSALEEFLPLITPEVWTFAASSLKNDDVDNNAGQAVRFCLILADNGLPTLKETTASSDVQAASLARAIIDALKGSHDAFGFLGSKVALERTPFGPQVETPAWHAELVEKYMGQERYP